MPIQRLNHAVLFVSDLARSTAFYRDVLEFRPLPQTFPGAAFLQAAGSANDHDLGGPRTDHAVWRQVFAAAESDGGPGRVRDAR
ncbi:VOC family protein [Streptomyces sp. NPDC051286]|uniref:VOC family protein n=1 Tax=Streptomyces sp. NPDC051286 TaxID=3365647 RepID=UPI0037A125B6